MGFENRLNLLLFKATTMPLKIRYRAPSGPGTLDLDDDATVRQLFNAVKEKTGSTSVAIKYGWPPQTLDTERFDASVVSLNLQRESLTIVPSESAAAPSPAPLPAQPPAPTVPISLDEGLEQKNINDGPVAVKVPGEDGFLGKSGG